jgi:hypothetical protein
MKCRCGCGEPVRGKRVFVDKVHQLNWMAAGGAREIGALQPLEAKKLGGQVAGRIAAESGRLPEAARKGGARAREIAARWRAAQAEKEK